MKKLFFILASLTAVVLAVAGMFEAATGVVLAGSGLTLVPGKFIALNGEEVPMMSRAEKDLYDQLITQSRANPVTRRAIEAGAISFDPIDYYVRFNITGLSGNQKIAGQFTTKVVGTTNLWPQAIFPQYYNFCFDRISVKTGTANTANAAVTGISNWTSVRSSVDAAVANGEIIVRSNRNSILETDISGFLSDAAVTGAAQRNAGAAELDKSRFFLEQLGIEVELALAGTVSNTANTTTWVEVKFLGVQARLKA